MKIKAGKCWEFPIKVVSRSGNYVTVNVNKGALLAFQLEDGKIVKGWYDAVGGPEIKDWSFVYIWNSKELNTKGNPKMGFTIKKSDMEELL